MRRSFKRRREAFESLDAFHEWPGLLLIVWTLTTSLRAKESRTSWSAVAIARTCFRKSHLVPQGDDAGVHDADGKKLPHFGEVGGDSAPSCLGVCDVPRTRTFVRARGSTTRRQSSHSKSAATYLQEEEAPGFEAAEYYGEDPSDADADESHIYIEEGDMDRIYSEEEVQLALATYQEVRKAIQMNQKGRKFYKGAQSGKGRGSQQGNDYYKNKQRVHIEQLKLRTRCAR